MRFEWDDKKARVNREKHGVSFDEAALAMDDPEAWTTIDTDHSTSREQREWRIGLAGSTLLVVIFTRRIERDSLRIISARRAGRRDRRKYERRNAVSLAPGQKGDT